jgi:hypothetical protein
VPALRQLLRRVSRSVCPAQRPRPLRAALPNCE